MPRLPERTLDEFRDALEALGGPGAILDDPHDARGVIHWPGSADDRAEVDAWDDYLSTVRGHVEAMVEKLTALERELRHVARTAPR